MATNEDVEKTVRMILGPIAALLRSRKFVAAIAGIFIMWLTAQVPSLAPYQAELILAISIIISVIVGGIAHEDAAASKAAAIEAAARTNQENTQAAIEAAVEAFYNQQGLVRSLSADFVPAEPVTVIPPVDPAAVG